MIAFKKTISSPLKNTKGFTIIEIMVVSVIISILASIAIPTFSLFRNKAYDTMALSDARNLVDSVINATLDEQDVDYNNAAVPAGGHVGEEFTDNTPRSPVYTFSPGVAAFIIGDTVSGPNNETTYFEAYVYHTKGTPDAGVTVSGGGKKEFMIIVNEAGGVITLP